MWEARARGDIGRANLWNNVAHAAAYGSYYPEAYKKQYHVDPKNDLSNDRIIEILRKSPRMISSSGGPGNDPKTPIHPKMARAAGLYNKGMISPDPEKSSPERVDRVM
jgi:hypothetical protein